MKSRRIGRFTIDAELIDHQPDIVKAALANCIVVRAERLWHRDAIEYVAVSDGFDEIELGCEAPLYMAVMTQVDGRPSFHAWQRAA